MLRNFVKFLHLIYLFSLFPTIQSDRFRSQFNNIVREKFIMATASDTSPVAIIFAFIFFLCGIFIFISGLASIRRRRLLQDTPTSKIRSIAMGLVEIFGEVVPIKNKTLKSPFSKKDCVYYQWSIEEKRGSVEKSRKTPLIKLE